MKNDINFFFPRLLDKTGTSTDRLAQWRSNMYRPFLHDVLDPAFSFKLLEVNFVRYMSIPLRYTQLLSTHGYEIRRTIGTAEEMKSSPGQALYLRSYS